jgi:hypothetical protein
MLDFFLGFGVVSLAIIFGTLGGVIGDALRRWAHPDAQVIGGGFFEIIGQKIFWAIGPQVIGCGIGIGFSFYLFGLLE